MSETQKTFKIIGGDLSDGYHTFDELYEHRHLLFLAGLKSGFFKAQFVVEDHFEGWDLIVAHVVIGNPSYYSQISYHLPNRLRGLYEHLERRAENLDFDNHDSSDVLVRLKTALQSPPPEVEKEE